MPAVRKYPPELRERAQCLVAEAMVEDPSLSLTAAVKRIGERVGIVPETLRGWIKQADVDAGRRPGTTTEAASTIKEVQSEVRELKRANEILLGRRATGRDVHHRTVDARERTARGASWPVQAHHRG